MQISDGMISGTLILSVTTLMFASIALCVKMTYKKKNDSSKGSCCWGCFKWENTRDVKVEEDIELGLLKNELGIIKKTPIFGGGSIEGNSDFNSDFNSDSKR